MATGTLYVIATPIGNLADLSPRAREVLGSVDLLLCEDTRHTGHLLSALGLRTEAGHQECWSLHAHNELAKVPGILERLHAGQNVGLVSDAGTPALSDPGQLLVHAAHEAGIPVRTLPGPFAVAAALAASGLTPIPFAFWGFLPKKAKERRTLWARVLHAAADGQPMTHAFYVPGRDLDDVCAELAVEKPASRVCVARELTKVHEGYVLGRAADIPTLLDAEMLRGEAVLLVEVAELAPVVGEVADPRELVLAAKAAGTDRKVALKDIGERTGLSRNALYALWMGE